MVALGLFKKIKVHTAISKLHSESYCSYHLITAKCQILFSTSNTDNYVH